MPELIPELMPEQPFILIVDDDVIFVDVLARAFRRRGYAVLAAQNSQQALQLAQAQPPSFAVVDLKIAVESGLDCIQPLLKIKADMRILMLTGYASVATAVTAIKAGAYDYACKPLDADEILQKLAINTAVVEQPSLDIATPLSVKRLAWEHIQRMLQENAGNISATARRLGMHRRTLQRMLQKKPTSK
jgi:two-component system, response regulator RegA